MPTIAGKYEVIGKIGQGGMGAVYKARHVVLDTVVALKMLPDHLADDPDLVARFTREARVMAQLRHEGIVRVHDIDRDGSSYYLIEEFVDGENLAVHLKRRGALPGEEAIEIAAQVARALAFAHSRNVTHRDIKPSNVLIPKEPPLRALVADFGIAKVDEAGDRTQTGTMLGSIKYAAPEQLGYALAGRPVCVDGRADVFSLALVLYEMCEGRPFFADLEPTRIIAVMVNDREPLVPRFSKPVSAGVVELVSRALRRDPDERPASMVEFLSRLEACRHYTDLPTLRLPKAPPREPADRTAPTPAPDFDDTLASTEVPWLQDRPERHQPRRRLPYAWGAGGAVAVAATALFLLVGRQGHLRWAEVTPQGAEASVEAGGHLRFAVHLADAERYQDARFAWSVDGVPRGDGRTWEFDPSPADGGATRAVSVVARTANETLEQAWRVRVVPASPTPTEPKIAVVPSEPPPTLPPETRSPPPPLRIAARVPAGDAPIALEEGHSVEFAVRLDDADAAAGYTWTLDGKGVGREATWRFTAPEYLPATVSHRVEVEVSRSGNTPARAAWKIDLAASRPRIVDAEPRRGAVSTPAGIPVRFTARSAGPVAQYEWRVDRQAAPGASDGTFVLSGTLAAGNHEVEVTAIDAHGTPSAPHRWTVAVHAAAPSPATPAVGAEEKEVPSQLTEAEVREWITHLRTAYDRNDASALRGLGIVPDTEQNGRVEIGEASIILDSRGATVVLDRTDTDGAGAAHVRRQGFRLTRGASGLVAAPR